MATQQVNRGGASGSAGGSAVAGSVGKGARQRKVYSYTMNEKDKYALHTVQRAQSALRVVNDAIKSGTQVNAKIIELCQEIDKTAGQVLFAST